MKFHGCIGRKVLWLLRSAEFVYTIATIPVGQPFGIVERTLPSAQTKSQLDMARTFFEKLWWYDQVVFDASRCGARKEEA